MKLLILGGTMFVGRVLTEIALARGHQVSLFHRGKTNADLFPEAEHLHGDRDGHLDALKGRTWDAVIDTSGYVPRIVRQSAELLHGSVGRYLFISTISVYPDSPEPNRTEDVPLVELDDPTTENVGEAYGELKVLCERVVQGLYGNHALIVRPGLVVGRYDPTNRFTYYVTRAEKGGQILAPNEPKHPVQFIDVRDLAEFSLDLIEQGHSGVYNATSPADAFTLGSVLAECQAQSSRPSELVWVPEAFLLEQEVAPWSELPLWIPLDAISLLQLSVAKGQAVGLKCRSLADIVADTRQWVLGLETPPGRAGMSAERERAVLDAFLQQATS